MGLNMCYGKDQGGLGSLSCWKAKCNFSSEDDRVGGCGNWSVAES